MGNDWICHYISLELTRSCYSVLVIEPKNRQSLFCACKFIIRLCFKLCEGKDDDIVFMNFLEEEKKSNQEWLKINFI